MKALLAIAEREIRDRWLLLAGAVCIGLMPWMLAPLDRSRMSVTAGGILGAMLFGLIVPVLTGWSVIGRDLSEGRLAFFFTRPTPWWAIWGGKWLAGALVTLSSALVMWLIVVPLDPEASTKMRAWFLEGSVALAGACCLLILAASHVASIAFRSRSLLLVLDIVLLAAAAFLFIRLATPWIAFSRIWSGQANWFIAGCVAFLAAVITLAGAVQVAVGRIDKRRGHRAMSAALWPSVAVLIAIASVWGHRLNHLRLEDLSRAYDLSASSQGTWFEVFGSAKDGLRHGLILVDSASGRSLSLSILPSPSWAAFSDDGRRAVWIEESKPLMPFSGVARGRSWDRLVVARLDGPSPSMSRLSLASPVRFAWRNTLALSPDGTRLAVLNGEMLDVFDVASGHNLVRIPAAEDEWIGPLLFASRARLHAYRAPRNSRWLGARTIELVEIDSDKRLSATTLGRLSLSEGEAITQAYADGRLLVRTIHDGFARMPGRPGPSRIEVRAMPAARVLTSITISNARLHDALLIDDGRVAILASDDTGTLRLNLHSADGALVWSLPFADGNNRGRIGGLLSAETLTVTIGPATSFARQSTVVVLLSNGVVVRSHAGARIVGDHGWNKIRALSPLAARVLQAEDGGLVVLDPGGKSIRRLLGQTAVQ
jgi:hypothetical protein